MADDSNLERSEQPTPRRLAKAAEEGQVVRSRDLATFVLLLAGAGLATGLGSLLIAQLSTLLAQGLAWTLPESGNPAFLMEQLRESTGQALALYLPLALLLLVLSVAASLGVGGLVFSLKPLQLDLSRLDPVAGLARLFSAQKWLDLLKDLIKMVLFFLAIGWLIYHSTGYFLAISTTSWAEALPLVGQLFTTGLLLLAGLMLLVTALDVPLQQWSHQRRLRMTREEVRRELKESEGDPHLKAQIRARQREAAQRRMMAAVPGADVVVVNPLHYAVALAYREGSMGAPKVVAKGQRLIAQRIRDLAREANVPVVEAPPLARALYAHTLLDREIPARLYAASAIVLAFVYQLKADQIQAEHRLMDLPVPTDLDPAGAP